MQDSGVRGAVRRSSHGTWTRSSGRDTSLTSQQLDSAFAELAKFDKDWETLLTQRQLKASQRAQDLLSSPLFLNLAVAGRLRPSELLNCDEAQELRDLVLERYLYRVLLTDQSVDEPKDVRRYLTWIARFLKGAEVSPFGLKTTDSTVFDLADLTPHDPPMWYRLFAVLAAALVFGLVTGLVFGLVGGLLWGLLMGLFLGPSVGLLASGAYFAGNSRLIPFWPLTRSQLLDILRSVGQHLVGGLLMGLLVGLALELSLGLVLALVWGPICGLLMGLALGLVFGLAWGLVARLNWGGWFVLLQKVAHRHLARAGNLPPRPADFLEWGIEQHIFRRVGGGVRFRHSLIQQHLANTSVGEQKTSTV